MHSAFGRVAESYWTSTIFSLPEFACAHSIQIEARGHPCSNIIFATQTNGMSPSIMFIINKRSNFQAQQIVNRQHYMSRFGKLVMDFGCGIEGIGMVLSMIFYADKTMEECFGQV